MASSKSGSKMAHLLKKEKRKSPRLNQKEEKKEDDSASETESEDAFMINKSDSTKLTDKDEVVCLCCSNPGVNPMQINYAKNLAYPVFCNVCGLKQEFKDKVHVCNRENDPGHKKNPFFKENPGVGIGLTTFILCYRCRRDAKDIEKTWDIERNYWTRNPRQIKNEPQHDKYSK